MNRYPENFRTVVDEDTEGFFRWNFERAENGDVSAARELLSGFCAALESGKPIPKAVMDYLYVGFSKFLSGEMALEKALNLNARKGRKKGTVSHNPIFIVSTYHLLMKRDGKRPTDAKETMRDKIGIDPRHIERLDNDWNQIREFSVEELEQLAEDNRH